MATKKRKMIPLELQRELEEIYGVIKEHPEVKPTGVHLISTIKSEFEGRGVIPEDKLNRLRKAFKAMIISLEESCTEEERND